NAHVPLEGYLNGSVNSVLKRRPELPVSCSPLAGWGAAPHLFLVSSCFHQPRLPHPLRFSKVVQPPPTGFALEGRLDAKRVYEKTTKGRARDARQELHNAERAAAPQR